MLKYNKYFFIIYINPTTHYIRVIFKYILYSSYPLYLIIFLRNIKASQSHNDLAGTAGGSARDGYMISANLKLGLSPN